MKVRHSCWFCLTVSLVLTGIPALADDIRPDSDEHALSDEKCIEQCDVESDRCMQASGGDSRKMEACDDQYSQCLQACEGH